MLSSDELSSIRADIALMLPDTCNLLSASQSPDSYGGVTETWGTVTGGTAVPCRLDYKSGTRMLTGGAIQSYTGWMLTLPYSTTITTGYRVQHGGYTYTVKVVEDDKSWKASTRAQVERI